MNYKAGVAKMARLITFEASSSTYNVMIVEGAEGWALVIDGEGRWVARVPKERANDAEQVKYFLQAAGRSEVDAQNIAEAIVADHRKFFAR